MKLVIHENLHLCSMYFVMYEYEHLYLTHTFRFRHRSLRSELLAVCQEENLFICLSINIYIFFTFYFWQRSHWEAQTSELLALCHEAAERRASKTGAFRGIHHDHAEAERMSLAFIQDRIDTDDPMRGYAVRTDDAQVFQILTTIRPIHLFRYQLIFYLSIYHLSM